MPGPVGAKVSLLLCCMCKVLSQSCSRPQKQLFQNELASLKNNFKEVQQRLLLAKSPLSL